MNQEPERIRLPDGSIEDFWSLEQLGEQAEDLFVKNMIRFRDKRDVTQGGLANMLQASGLRGMYQTTLSRIEKRERALKLHEAFAIARVLGSSIEQMLRPTETYEAVQNVLKVHAELGEITSTMVSAMQQAAKVTQEGVQAVATLREQEWKQDLSADEIARVESAMTTILMKSESGLKTFVPSVERAFAAASEMESNNGEH